MGTIGVGRASEGSAELATSVRWGGRIGAIDKALELAAGEWKNRGDPEGGRRVESTAQIAFGCGFSASPAIAVRGEIGTI